MCLGNLVRMVFEFSNSVEYSRMYINLYRKFCVNIGYLCLRIVVIFLDNLKFCRKILGEIRFDNIN